MIRLPEFFSPVSDAELPHLQRQKLRGAVAFAAVLGTISFVVAAVDFGSGRIALWRALALLGLNVATAAACLLLARLPAPPVDAMLMALSLVLLGDFISVGWLGHVPRPGNLGCAPSVPLLLAGTAPWRPVYCFVLALVSATCILVGAAVGLPIPGDVHELAFTCIWMGAGGAVASQVQRRVWQKLEAARLQLAASDRMSVLGRMTAGIAHEMKTPLAAAMNGIESTRLLATELTQSIGHPDVEPHDLAEIAREMHEAAEGAASATRRAARFISAIRSHTLQMTETDSAPFAVRSAIAGAVTLVEHAGRQAGVAIDLSRVDPELVVTGDQSKLTQVITNLVCNAVDACAQGRGSTVVVTASAEGEDILVVVEDDGPGVPAAIRERIFEALFTTKRDAEGTGLGLAISRDVAEGAFGGTLTLVATPRGARFEMKFPRRAAKVSGVRAWEPARAA